MAVDADEITAKYLWKLSNTFGKSTELMSQEMINIRLHLREICVSRLELERGKDCLEKPSERARRGLCPKCLADWPVGEGGGARARVKAVGRRRKADSRLLRLDPSAQLGKCRTNLKKLFAKRVDQFMVLSCRICGNVSRVGLQKPERVIEEPETSLIDDKVSEISESSFKKKKRKKKRESFAGLNASYVVTPKRKRKDLGASAEVKEIHQLSKIEGSQEVEEYASDRVTLTSSQTCDKLSSVLFRTEGINSSKDVEISANSNHQESQLLQKSNGKILATPVSTNDRMVAALTENKKWQSGNKKKRKKSKPAKRKFSDQPTEKKKSQLSAFLDSLAA